MIDNRIYVGQTYVNPPMKRIVNHFTKTNKTYIGRSIRKIGKENFCIEILEKIYENTLNEVRKTLDIREIFWIDYFNSTNKSKGFNRTCGGQLTHVPTEETCKKISNANKGRFAGEKNPFFGKTHNQCTIEKIKKANIGRKKDPSEIRKLINSQKNSEVFKKRFKSVVQVMKTGEIVVYDSIASASKKTGIKSSQICICCKRRGSTAFDSFWRYESEFDKDENFLFPKNRSQTRSSQKIIGQFNSKSELVKIYGSVSEVILANPKMHHSGISFALSGRYKSSFGYTWKLISE